MSENAYDRAIPDSSPGNDRAIQSVRQTTATATPAANLLFLKKSEKSLIFEKTAPSLSLFSPGKALAEAFFDLQITFKLLNAAQTVSFETQFVPSETERRRRKPDFSQKTAKFHFF